MTLPNSTKFLKSLVLISQEEMDHLLKELGSLEIYILGKIQNRVKLSIEEFLEHYKYYISNLKEGKQPPRLPTLVWTNCKGVEIQNIEGKGGLARPQCPMLLLQPAEIKYESTTKSFKPMGFGKDLISWGFQISYPTLYQDPISGKIEKILEDPKFKNTLMFKRFQKWLRAYTSPTPFLIEGEKINVPLRLGKRCFEWIQHHTELKKRNLIVSAREFCS